MRLAFLTEDGYDKLYNGITENEKKYTQEEEWLTDFFKGTEWFKQSKSVDVKNFTPVYRKGEKTDAEKNAEDLVNVRLIYEAFKKLTPLQASNKYMWTYLCHAVPEYSAYIRDRWMTQARENTIKTRFFVTGATSLLNDNALARLWWYGYLTYDESFEDHYALTKILLTNQTICTDVLDTLNRMKHTRMKGVLLGIRDYKDLYGEKGITDRFRECKKRLNRMGATINLDYLDTNEIRTLTLKFMEEAGEKPNRVEVKNNAPQSVQAVPEQSKEESIVNKDTAKREPAKSTSKSKFISSLFRR